MTRAELDTEARFVSTFITQADLDAAGIDWGDIDNLIDAIRMAEEADVALLAKVHDDGRVRVSMRSRGDTDVGSLAVSMGGGGHRLAAGFTADGEVEGVIEKVREAIEEYR
jgi:phosphoesterase RecJ-like protein